MVHVRTEGPKHGYANWGVRVNAATLQVTHISAGPILSSANFLVEDYFSGSLVVASYHIIKSDARKHELDTLRMFLGEGDRYSAYQDVSLQDVEWWGTGPLATRVFDKVDNLRAWWINNLQGIASATDFIAVID